MRNLKIVIGHIFFLFCFTLNIFANNEKEFLIKTNLPLSKIILKQKNFENYTPLELREYAKLIKKRLNVSQFEVIISDVNSVANLISSAIALEELKERRKENKDDRLLRAEIYLNIFKQGKILKNIIPFIKGMKEIIHTPWGNIFENSVEKMENAGKIAFLSVKDDAERIIKGIFYLENEDYKKAEKFLCGENKINIFCWKALYGEGKLEKSEDIGEKLIKKEPYLKWEIIQFKEKIKKNKELLQAEKDYREDNDNWEKGLKYALLLFENGKVKEAGEIFENLLKKYDNNPKVIEKSAIFYLNTQQIERWKYTIELGRKIKLQSKNFIEQWVSGLFSFSSLREDNWENEKKEALKILSQISPEKEKLAKYINSAQIILNKNKEPEEIEKLNKKYLDKLKNNITAWKLFLVLNYINNKEFENFEELVRKLPSNIKKNEEIRIFIAKIYLVFAVKEMNDKILRKAEALFREIKKNNPSLEITYYSLIIEWLIGKENLFDKFKSLSLNLNPYKKEEEILLHSLFLYLSDKDKEYINRARKILPSHLITRYFTAKLFYSMEDYVGAYEELEACLRDKVLEEYSKKIHKFMAEIARKIGEDEIAKMHEEKIRDEELKTVKNFFIYGNIDLEIGYNTKKGLILKVDAIVPVAKL